MADFAAVLRKTLEGLGDTTPAMRARVYDKARGTITAKLAALNPPPPASVAERQRKALEDAIASVESSFAAPAPAEDPLDELENVFSSINAQRTSPPPLRRTAPAASAPANPTAAAPTPRPAASPRPPAMSRPAASPPKPAPAPARPEPEPVNPFEDEPELDRLGAQEPSAGDESFEWEESRPKKRRLSGLVAAVLALAVLGGGTYAVWLNGDEFQKLTGITLPALPGMQPSQTTPARTPSGSAAPEEGTDAGEEGEPADAPAAQPSPAPQETAVATAPAQPATPPKFTQRLDAGGRESDAGPAGGQNGVGEGTSVAQLTPPAVAGNGAQPAAPAAAAPAQPATPPAAGQTVLVGQRAIFYEERTSAAPGSAETGNIVWSTVQESPGGDLPPETAIRAEATIPGKDLQLRMTIRRNADRTLPASHIIEMIFLSQNATGPEAIDTVLRVSMKGTEQDPGSPLLGNAAKIADGYFLLALDDGKGQVAANLAMLRQQDWIDIPVVYKSGRRALFTMEKGIPGEKVFNDALAAWQQSTNG